MRMRALMAAGPALLSACSALPGDVRVDLGNGSVTAGACSCTLPIKPPAGNDQQPR